MYNERWAAFGSALVAVAYFLAAPLLATLLTIVLHP